MRPACSGMDDDTLNTELTKVRGLGQWSVDMFGERGSACSGAFGKRLWCSCPGLRPRYGSHPCHTSPRAAMFHLGHPDILPVGDLGVRKGMQWLYGLKVSVCAGVRAGYVAAHPASVVKSLPEGWEAGPWPVTTFAPRPYLMHSDRRDMTQPWHLLLFPPPPGSARSRDDAGGSSGLEAVSQRRQPLHVEGRCLRTAVAKQEEGAVAQEKKEGSRFGSRGRRQFGLIPFAMCLLLVHPYLYTSCSARPISASGPHGSGDTLHPSSRADA